MMSSHGFLLSLELHTISKKLLHLAEVHQVVIKYNIHRPWQLPGWSLLWHLLDTQCLVVTVDRQTKLCLQRVAILILAEGIHELLQ